MNDLIRYSNREEFPSKEYPVLTDYFYNLSNEFEKRRRNKTIKKIIGIYPIIRKSKIGKYPLRKGRNPYEIEFPVFCTNRTAYAAIKEVAPVLTKFYMETSIFPVISPYHIRIYEHLEDILPRPIVDSFKIRGAVLYDVEA